MALTDYFTLGRSGLRVSPLCLGTMTFGQSEWGCDEAISAQMIHDYVDAGGNFLDTADVYGAGEAERLLGQALRQARRESVEILTKVFMRVGPGANDRGTRVRIEVRA